jgi:putative endonuclease
MATGSGEGRLGFVSPKQLLCKITDAARQFRQSQTLNATAALGRKGEDLAHRYLQSAGFKIVARNYRPSGGEAEIDIVARDGEITVFVEVKARQTDEFGSPDRAIGLDKQANIVRAARRYASRGGIEWNKVRFDTVSIVFSNPPAIVHEQDAFFKGRTH